MMKKTIFHTLAASVMLAATAGLMMACTSNDDNPVVTPLETTDFAPAAAEAVDLGLPSGTKWANMNVGAEAPEDFGFYFAWGETVGYTSDMSDGRSFDWASYKWCNGSNNTQTKYCTKSDYGTVDNKTVLDPEDDAAHVNWGGSWRMPTYEDFQELLDNTTNEWVIVGGISGRKFTSKTNGNSIFLPAVGSRTDSNLNGQSTGGFYWSSSVNLYSSYYANYLRFFNSGMVNTYSYYRFQGQSVRPVQ